MSGRSLRRLPVLAHARYIGLGFVPSSRSRATTSTTPSSASSSSLKINGTNKVGAGVPNPGVAGLGVSVETWLSAMDKVVENREIEVKRF